MSSDNEDVDYHKEEDEVENSEVEETFENDVDENPEGELSDGESQEGYSKNDFQPEQEEEETDNHPQISDDEEDDVHKTANDSDQDEKTANTDNDSDEEFTGFGEEEFKTGKKSKKRAILSDDDESEKEEETAGPDSDNPEEENIKKRSKKHKKEKSKKKKNQSSKGEEDEGNEVPGENDTEIAPKQSSDNDDDDEAGSNDLNQSPVKKNKRETSEVDMLLNKNKSNNPRRNRKKDSEEITDMDNKISMIIVEMKNVAAEDRAANEKNLTTLQKLKMMPIVTNMLKKSEYHATMIELGMLGAIAEWLAPLPDRSLPNIKIRELLIDALKDFGEINADYLKSSGIGKAVMFLFKHSKEIKSNKQKLEKLINSWARPIFNLDGNFKQLTKEERLERDMEHVKTLNKRNMEQTHSASVDDALSASDKIKTKKAKKNDDASSGSDEPSKFLRPGDPGFCPRARVPIPSSKDYIIRPKSNIESLEMAASSKKHKKSENRLDKHKKRFIELKNKAKTNRAVTMVAAGGK